MLRVHVETSADAELSTALDELVAEGARRMLAAALEAEVDAYVYSFAGRPGPQAGDAQRPRGGPVAGHRSGTHRGPGSTGQRPSGRRGDGRTGALPVLDP